MNAALRIVLLGTLFVGAPLASGTASGLAFVALACAAATLVEGRPGPIPIIAGSLGALAAALPHARLPHPVATRQFGDIDVLVYRGDITIS